MTIKFALDYVVAVCMIATGAIIFIIIFDIHTTQVLRFLFLERKSWNLYAINNFWMIYRSDG